LPGPASSGSSRRVGEEPLNFRFGLRQSYNPSQKLRYG